MRTSVRLSLQFSFLYALLSAIVFALAYWFTQYEVKDWVLERMEGDVETLTKVFDADGAGALQTNVDALAQVSFESTRIFQLQDSEGNIVSGNITSVLEGDIPDYLVADRVALSTPVHDEVSVYWMRQDQIGPFNLIQGSGDHIVAEILEALVAALIVGYLGVISLGLLAGVRVGRLTEQRIINISDVLDRAANGQLAARISDSPETGDDLMRVSLDINQMLDKTQRLLESQQQISNDIAHDMRTPLQRLRQRLESMRDAREVAERDVAACLEQTEEIVATFNALLRIAQIEASTRQERFGSVNLPDIVRDVVETFAPVAEDAGKSLKAEIENDAPAINGDAQLLTQLLVNLIDNAIKHSADGQAIKVDLSRKGPELVLSVSDDGQGIDPDQHDKVFRRFFRTETSRSSPGNGLGLAIVKAISDVHGAAICVENLMPGIAFRVKFGTMLRKPCGAPAYLDGTVAVTR